MRGRRTQTGRGSSIPLVFTCTSGIEAVQTSRGGAELDGVTPAQLLVASREKWAAAQDIQRNFKFGRSLSGHEEGTGGLGRVRSEAAAPYTSAASQRQHRASAPPRFHHTNERVSQYKLHFPTDFAKSPNVSSGALTVTAY